MGRSRFASARAIARWLFALVFFWTTHTTADEGRFSSLARALGAISHGDDCTASRSELARRTIADWRVRPGADTFAPEWLCHALGDTVARDSMHDCTPRPIDIFANAVVTPQRIVGEMSYLGIDPREYAYDILPNEHGKAIVEVRIMFLGPLARTSVALAKVQEKLIHAAAFWSRFSPDQQIEFRFLAVTHNSSNPHFDVTLVPGSPRTPFDSSWGIDWSWHLIAHEVGHMLGLDDEYEQLRKTFGHAIGAESRWLISPSLKMNYFHCDLHSLMCDSKNESSTPQRYHYYLILRRRYCRATPSSSYPF